jgi:fucose 4-O-acetylase-like acetyltransferase
MDTLAEKKTRIDYYDVAKGIGIILVAWTHSGGPFSSYIAQFYMPMFFILSGLLYSDKSTFKEYFKKKLFSLYIPFITWNLLFYFVRAIPNMSADQILPILKQTGLILLTLSRGAGQFLGATWFLGGLFVISILYKIVDMSIVESKYKDIIILLVFTALAILGFQVTFEYTMSRTIILGLYFAVGAFCKKHKSELAIMGREAKFLAIISAIIFIVMGSFNSASMGANKFKYPVLFVFGAFLASYSLIYFSKAISSVGVKIVKFLKNILVFLGKRTIDILIWQIVFFRLVIIFQMLLNHEEMTVDHVLSYYPTYDSSNGWWILYMVVGLIVPILWGNLLRFGIWGKLLKKLHIV